MKKLLGLALSTLLLSSVAMAQDVKTEKSDDLTPPSAVETMHHKKQLTQADKERFAEKMKERKAAFAKRLNLTEEQQAKAKELQEKSKADMKEIHEEMKALRAKADAVREQSKKDFESLLTDDQKKTLSEINQEREKKMQERKERKGHHKGGKGPRPHDKHAEAVEK